METIAQGRRGKIVRFTNKKGERIGRKIAQNQEKKGAIQKEIEILTYLNKKNIDFVPQIIDQKEDSFDYYRIEGEHFTDAWKKTSNKQRKQLIHKLLKCGLALDTVGVIHGELAQPTKNVLVTKEGEIAILDFERGSRITKSPKNLRHLAQRLFREGYLKKRDLKEIGTITDAQKSYQYINNAIKDSSSRNSSSKSKKALFFYTGTLIAVDLLTKWLFYNQRLLEDFALFTPLFNEGIGWSIPMPIFWTIAISVLIILGLYFLLDKSDKYERLLIIFIGSGAIGNLIDRVFYHGVRDFIDLGFWPVFNVADILITIGAVIFVYHLLINRKNTA